MPQYQRIQMRYRQYRHLPILPRYPQYLRMELSSHLYQMRSVF
jgi:hypothetical protein